jgi:hypothetical protein
VTGRPDVEAPLMLPHEVAAILRVNASTLSRHRRRREAGGDRLPTAIYLTPRTPRYVRSEVESIARGLGYLDK